MRLVLKNKIEFNITAKEADNIQKLLDDEKIQFIHLGRQSIERKMIAGVFEGGINESDLPFNQIEPPKYNCVINSTSIQFEIHRRIMKEHKKTWAQLVKDKDFREKIRKQLYKDNPGKKWCDHKKGIHACLDNKTV